MTEAVRVDKWLWAARFYKTRSLAAQAVGGGRVQVNGERVKPARGLKPGDILVVNKLGFEYEVRVRALSGRRGPASQAQTLYDETPDSQRKRRELSEQHKMAAALAPRPARRPDKKARRQLRQLKG